MPELYNRLGLKLDSVLMATDFSAASKAALIYATAIARRNHSKLFVVHVSSSHSKTKVMDAWRTLQTELMDQFLAGRLKGVEDKPLVKSGDVQTVLSDLIAEYGIDLVVLGTRARTGIWNILLGSSVAESILRNACCPVLTVGPNVLDKATETGPQRILVPTGFAPQSLYAVAYSSWLAERLKASMALLHVVTDRPPAHEEERVRSERLERMRATVSVEQHGRLQPEFLVEFGSVTEKILDTAARWKADLIVLGVHNVDEAPISDTTWAKASEILRSASCPVLTVRLPHEDWARTALINSNACDRQLAALE